MDSKKSEILEEEEPMNISSQNLFRDDSKIGLFKSYSNASPSFSKLNKLEEKNSEMIVKTISNKSFKEDESVNDKLKHSVVESKESEFKGSVIYSDFEQDVNNRRLTKKEKIYDTDTEDEGSDTEKEVKWILLPDDLFKKGWDLLVAIIILYSSVVTPYKIAFIDEVFMEEFDIACDLLLGFDVIVNFFSAYYDGEDNVVKNRQKIVFSYLKTWFTIDVVSILPISYFTDASYKFNNLTRLGRLPKFYKLLKLTKLLRMTKIAKRGNVNRITRYFLEKLKVSANIERLIYFVLSFLLLNHISACIWFFVAKMQDLNPDCWVTRLGYVDSTNLEIYVISFYWCLTTVTTVGYGDISAGTTAERAYNLVIMSFGVLMYSFAIGSLSSIVSTLDAKTAEMNQKLQILTAIRKEFGLEQDIYDKVRKVIKYDLSRSQKDKMNFLQELPNKLRIELSQIMHDKVIQNLYFFRDQPNDFIAYVAPLLKPVKFSQNDFLYKVGDLIDEMYFVSKGTVIFCLTREYNEKEIKEVKKNNNFGEIEMCLNEKLSFNIKIKSRSCELFVLKKNDFLRLSVNFKEFIEKFLHKSLMIYLKFNEDKKKVQKEEECRMSKLGTDKKNKTGTVNGTRPDLEIVDEGDEEEFSEYYNSNFDSDEKSYDSDKKEDDFEESNRSSSQNNNNSSNAKMYDSPSRNQIDRTFSSKNDQLTNSNENQFLKKKTTKSAMNEEKLSKFPSDQDVSKNNYNSNSNNSETDDPIDKMKNEINKKFIKKIDKILEYIENNNIKFKNSENNPKVLLKQLRSEVNILEKNHIIDRIENIMKEFYKGNSHYKET